MIMNVDTSVQTLSVYASFLFLLCVGYVAIEAYRWHMDQQGWYNDYIRAIRSGEFEKKIYGIRKSRG